MFNINSCSGNNNNNNNRTTTDSNNSRESQTTSHTSEILDGRRKVPTVRITSTGTSTSNPIFGFHEGEELLLAVHGPLEAFVIWVVEITGKKGNNKCRT